MGPRRHAAACCTVLLLLPAAGCVVETPQRPNIILMLVDTLRADHLGSYGFEGPISPTADALARESVRFENCFSTAPWTPPT